MIQKGEMNHEETQENHPLADYRFSVSVGFRLLICLLSKFTLCYRFNLICCVVSQFVFCRLNDALFFAFSLQLIFENRIKMCHDCNICNLYKRVIKNGIEK